MIFSVQSSIGSALIDTLPEETEKNFNEKIQGDHLSPKTRLYSPDLGANGSLLSGFIKQQGNNPPLEEICLCFYSMQENKWAELLQFTSKCKNLRKLNLGYTTIGEAGYWLTQSITLIPSLRKLHLNHCSIPEQVWSELLQSLTACKQLSDLDLSHNTIGEAGHYLAESITSWGDNPRLESLNLQNCSIPEQLWPELFQSLSSCKQLTYLRLSYNTIGEARHYLAQSITSLGDNPPLKDLYLSDCSIQEQVWPELFQFLSSCQQLKTLYIDGNTVTDCLSSFMSDPHPGLTSLQYLDLEYTAMNKSDIQHLIHLIRNNKLPCFKDLRLKEKNWTGVEDELKQLKRVCRKKKGLVVFLDSEWLRRVPKPQQVQDKSLFPKHESKS